MHKLRILGIHNQSGSAYYRIKQIAKGLIKLGHEYEAIDGQYGQLALVKPLLKTVDMVILQMTYDTKAVDYLTKNKVPYVFEIDDLIDKARKDDPWRKQLKPGVKEAMYNCINNAAAVTVTTDYLKEKYKYLNKNIVVLPNYLDLEDWVKPQKNISDTIRIGWAGSISHKADLLFLKPIIEKVVAKHDNVRFIYCGYGGASSKDGITDAAYGEDVFKGIPRSKREYILGVNTAIWPKKASALEFDIGLAPLIDDEFNKAKSNLKYLEYSWLEVPGVYSPTVYNNSVTHGKTGFIAETEEDWIKYIDKLIEDEELRRTIATNAKRELLDKYALDKHIKDWEKVYSSICPEKDRKSGAGNSKGKNTKT